MTDDTSVPDAAAMDTMQDTPHVQVHAQYVKDMSFENPGAPDSLSKQGTAPNIDVSVDVGARSLGPSQFEVELRITAHAAQGEKKAFVIEVLYAGVFTLHNVDKDDLKQVCLIECPRLLFPFARRVVADATRDGGFRPLLLDPIDFAQLFLQSMENAQETPAIAAGNGSGIGDIDGNEGSNGGEA